MLYFKHTWCSRMMVVYNMMHINMECTNDVLCAAALVGCARGGGAGTGIAAGAVYYACRFIMNK